MPRLRGVKRKRAGAAVVNAAAEAASFHELVTSVALFQPRPVRRALSVVAERFTCVAEDRAAFPAPLVEEAREAVRYEGAAPALQRRRDEASTRTWFVSRSPAPHQAGPAPRRRLHTSARRCRRCKTGSAALR